jgi:hypothetical protein
VTHLYDSTDDTPYGTPDDNSCDNIFRWQHKWQQLQMTSRIASQMATKMTTLLTILINNTKWQHLQMPTQMTKPSDNNSLRHTDGNTKWHNSRWQHNWNYVKADVVIIWCCHMMLSGLLSGFHLRYHLEKFFICYYHMTVHLKLF